MKYILSFLFGIVFFFISTSSSAASGFYLKTIGALDVEGGVYSQIWYTSENVTFTGIAPAGNSVTATVNGTSETATADANGFWSYTTTLNQGDNSVSFTTQGANPLSFTLTIGQVPEGVGEIPKAETPSAGVSYPTLFLLAGGSTFVLFSTYAISKNN